MGSPRITRLRMIVVVVALMATRSQAPLAARSDTTAPSVTITSPASGERVERTITISAAASDAIGVVSVTFTLDGTVLGSDAKPPYTVRWDTRKSAAGLHTLRAEARDAAGNVGISAAVTVTTGAVASNPTKAVFEPSADNSLVIGYRLDVFREGSDPATASPVATQDLGKPAVVNGEMTADISATIASLAAATYIATVTAVASSATARSTASPPFAITVTSSSALALAPASASDEPAASAAGSRDVLWVTNPEMAMVTAFDAMTGDVLATVPVGLRPAGIAVPKGVGKVYVADEGSDTVSVISKATMTLMRTIPLPPPFTRKPHHINGSPDGRFIYVGELGANVVDVIDTATDEISARFSTGWPGSKTRVVVPDPNGAVLYAVNRGAAPSPSTLVALDADTGQWLWHLPLEGEPSDFLITADGGTGVVTRHIDTSIDVIDLDRRAVIAELDLGPGHHARNLQLTLDGRLMLVTLGTTPTEIAVVDPVAMTTLSPISLARSAASALAARQLSYVCVSGNSELPPAVVAVDAGARTVVRRFRFPGGGSPYAAVLDAE